MPGRIESQSATVPWPPVVRASTCIDGRNKGAGGTALPTMSSNPFATEVAARIYAAGRPNYSKRVSDIIRKLIAVTEPVPCAVDIGSGTVISTMALAHWPRASSAWSRHPPCWRGPRPRRM